MCYKGCSLDLCTVHRNVPFFSRLKAKLRNLKVPKSSLAKNLKLKEALNNLNDQLESQTQQKRELWKAIKAEKRLVILFGLFFAFLKISCVINIYLALMFHLKNKLVMATRSANNVYGLNF